MSDLSHIYHRPGELFWLECDPFQSAVPCWLRKRYHLHKAHGREFICSVMSTETLVKLAFPYSNIEHAELDADVFIISPQGN